MLFSMKTKREKIYILIAIVALIATCLTAVLIAGGDLWIHEYRMRQEQATH
mgnify:CR=1 FL=1